MAGRFTARRVAAPEMPVIEEPAPPTSGVLWKELQGAPAEPTVSEPPPTNPLLSDKFLDAKVRLHRRLIEEINLSALEKLPEDEIRAHVLELVSRYLLLERLPLNAQELSDFVSEIYDEMTGLGPLRPLLAEQTLRGT